MITCPECGGMGTYHGKIEEMRLTRNMKHYDELIEFQKDAKRVIRQAAQLQALKPHRAESYEGQLRAALFTINAQAERASEAKT